MADTKQATPELEVIVEEIWRHYNRGDTTDAVLTLKAALDPRSGPDRTPQEPREWLIAKRGAAGQWINKNADAPIVWTHDEVLAYLAEAGPDRGQQDAPDETREILEDLVKAEMRTINHFSLGGKSQEQEKRYTLLESWLRLAKAAREGQAPKGDRIKVEREPGCKCEYAIWTNARGCPVHDVPGKSSDSEKQG